MAASIDAFDLVVFPDANVVLEGPPVDRAPWSELGGGRMLVLITRTVMRQIDDKKSDGRLGEVARTFRRLLLPLVNDHAVRVETPEGPIEFDFAPIARIPADYSAAHDLQDTDTRIVAEVLHAGIPLAKCVFISHDLVPISEAKAAGIRVVSLSDAWRRKTAADPRDRKIQQLKAENAELRSREPTLDLDVAFQQEDAPELIYRVAPLTADEREEVVDRLRAIGEARRRKIDSHAWSDSVMVVNRPDFDGFSTREAPAFARQVAGGLQEQYGQLQLRVAVRNVGNVPAERLTLELFVDDGWISDRPIVVDIAPRPQGREWVGPEIHVERTPGVHEMAEDIPPRRSDVVRWTCADFRQGRHWEFLGVVYLNPERTSPYAVRAVLSAANRGGTVEGVAEARVEVRAATVADLVDLEGSTWRIQPPFANAIREAHVAHREDEFEMVRWNE